MDELVQRLSVGKHPVEITIRPSRTVAALRSRIDDGYVHIKFTGTRGGTELGIRLDRDDCRIDGADFEAGTGQIRLAGRVKLNYVPVKCIADLDLTTMEGTGHLEILANAEM